jgi:pilus assembly protein CpaD
MWRARGLILGAALLTLGACAAEVEGWKGSTVKEHQVEWTVASHALRFEPDSRWLAQGELQRLDAFITRLDLRRPSHVYFAPPSGVSDLSERRSATLHALLRARGVSVRQAPPQPGISGALPNASIGPNEVTMMVGYYDVSVPNCFDHSKPTIGDFSNQPSSNFGCATAMNLGQMVADPRDLKGSTADGPVDAQRAIITVDEYQQGIQPVVPRETAGDGQKGG